MHVIKLSCHFVSIIISTYNQTIVVYTFQIHFNEKHNNITLNTFQWKHNSIVRLHHKVSISLHLHLLQLDLQLSLAMDCKVLPGRLVLHYTMPNILTSTSFLVYLAFVYQSLSSLYSKRFLWDSCPANSLVIPEGVFLYSLDLVLFELWHGARSCINIYPFCRNITHSHVISLSWIISLWYFALSMLPFTFLWRYWPLLLMTPQICTLAGNFTVVWINLAWYFTFCLRQTRKWRRLLWLWNTD